MGRQCSKPTTPIARHKSLRRLPIRDAVRRVSRYGRTPQTNADSNSRDQITKHSSSLAQQVRLDVFGSGQSIRVVKFKLPRRGVCATIARYTKRVEGVGNVVAVGHPDGCARGGLNFKMSRDVQAVVNLGLHTQGGADDFRCFHTAPVGGAAQLISPQPLKMTGHPVGLFAPARAEGAGCVAAAPV